MLALFVLLVDVLLGLAILAGVLVAVVWLWLALYVRLMAGGPDPDRY